MKERQRRKQRKEKKEKKKLVGVYLSPDLITETRRRVKKGEFQYIGVKNFSDLVEIALRYVLRLHEELKEAPLSQSTE